MATELLQDIESLSVSAQLGREYLQTGIASFEDVEEIVKSNLRKINILTHDENAQDGFPDHDEDYDDLLGMLNLQSSDLEEKDSTESNANEKIVTEDGGKNKNFSKVEVTTESSEMPQSSKDLLDDITLVINSDKNFSSGHHHVVSETEGLQRDSKEILASAQASRTLDTESGTVSSVTIPCNAEGPVKGLDNYNRVLKQGNLDQTEPLSAKDDYFEQTLNDLLDEDTSEVLPTPREHTVDQEDLLEIPDSLVSMLESSLVKLSCGMSPGQFFRDMDETVKTTADSRSARQASNDDDVTVDGEGGDNLDEISLELCQLSYDENLTCSFYERLQLSNDNGELVEHGQRGRPSRQKVTKQAVPCKIEPKVSQMGLQAGFLPPQLFSSAFQNIPPGVTSVVPSQLQPHLGQETLRFPVFLHRDTSRPGQLYLQLCPDIMQLTPSSQASGLSSSSQGDRHSPKGNSDQSCLSSKKEVTPENSKCGPSTDTSSHFPDDTPMVNQTNLSLEIDGPIRRQTSLNQGRQGGSRNDPYFRVATGSSDHTVGSLLEEPYRMQTVQENQSSAMSSHNFVPVGSSQNFVPSPFVGSSQDLMRVQDASGFGGNWEHGVPYISAGVQGSMYQHNQRLPVPVTFANHGTHDQSSQFPLPSNNHHYALGSSADLHSHHLSQCNNGQAMGHWTSEPNINIAASSVSHCLVNNNPFGNTMTSGVVPYARTSSPGLPNFPADPRSRRVQMLMAMGSQGLRQARVNSGTSDIPSTTMPPNLARLPALNSEDNSSMIQLSPPVELMKPQFVNQQPVNAPVTAQMPPSGAAADGSVMNKSVFHPKNAPSQSSTRSSKGPDLPVPVERSKARVEQWLSNHENEMFRPELDSGTFDPSDHSLVNEPSIPPAARQYPEAAGIEQSLLDKSYQCLGLFEGKRMTVTPPQPSPKQKGNKRTGAVNPHGKGLSLGQLGQSRHSIISDASVITESSLSSGQTNSSKDKYTDKKNDASSDCQGKSTGRRPVVVHAEVPLPTCAKFNQEHPQIRQTPLEDLPLSTQSLSSYPAIHLDETQQADLAIDEDIKQLEQKSFEKQLTGIFSSITSGQVLNELEQFLRSDLKSSSGGTSASHQGSGFKLEAVATGSSKESSFDTSKYITRSDIESLEKKKAQNGKSSLDNYLEQVRCFSNENMHTEQNASNQNDGKQLMNIPLNDIADVIGLHRELGQQPSRLENVLPHLQFENRQKAVKRRPGDHSDEAASFQMGQTAAVGGQNAAAGGRNVAFGGRGVLMGGQYVGEQNVALGGQNAAMGAQSRPVGGQNATVSGQSIAAYGQNNTMCGQNTEVSGQSVVMGRKDVTNVVQNNKMSEMLTSVFGMPQTGNNISAECLPVVTQNFGNQSYLVFSEQGRIPQTVVGPPSKQPDFLMKKGFTQNTNFQIPSTTLPGPSQAKPVYEPPASQTSHSGKMQSDFQLPDFSDGCYETEMHSSPSSVEILKESTSSFNNEHFTVAGSKGNQFAPVSTLSHTQHLMQPLSTHSVITSASILANSHFKKPQNPGSSTSSSSTTHRAAGPSYPSVDSDVSMSSDTSLPNSVMLHDGNMDPKNKIDLQQLSPQQHCEQYSAQFQQINPQQPGKNMLHSIQQQVQNQKQQQLLMQQHCLQLEKNQHQKPVLLEQQKHLQMEHSQQQQKHLQMEHSQQQQKHLQTEHSQQQQKHLQMEHSQQQQKHLQTEHSQQQQKHLQMEHSQQQQKHLQMEHSQQQQQMDNQQRCLQMQTQQQIRTQDYFQMLEKQQQMLNQQTLRFLAQHQMQQQHQGIRNSHQHCEKNQQKEPKQQLEELLIQQQPPTQFNQMQIQQQQQLLKQGKHSQQQLTNQQHQQIQNHQQHLHLQNQQLLHLQQIQMQLAETAPSHLLQNQQQMQLAETAPSHLLQNQQQMQQYQQVLNQEQYQQMHVQQLQQPQMQKQQQKQTENQQLQQQQRLCQQMQEQPSAHCSTFTNICVPQKTSGSQAGSSCSDPQSCHVLPGNKLKERSISQISDSVYSQQLGNLSPTSENAHDLSNSIADNDLALVPQRDRHLTGSSNQSGHGRNIFNNLHNNSLAEHNQQAGLRNCSKPASGNEIPGNTLACFQQSSSSNSEIAEQDQVLKSAMETQLQKYLKEGFPSLNSVEYCQDAFAVASFLPANIPSLSPDQPHQSLAKVGPGLDSGEGSSDKSNRLLSAERSREQADSDLSVFSLGSGEDLLSFQQDNDGETPLHLLSELPREGISSLPSMPGFYEALNVQNKNQETALDIAVKNENLDAVRFLVSHGADVNIFCLSSQKGAGSKTVYRNETVQQTALHEAVELGNREIVEVLLTSQNVKVDVRRPDSGLTPLMLALQLHRQSDRKEIIKLLINHQASLRLHDTIQGKTPLMFAIQSKDVSLVEDILQQVGAERARELVNDRAKKDMTCLHFAAELRLESSQKKKLLRCIIVAGGDPSSKNSEGETPRDWARADINEVLQNLARLYNS
ncbi:hypothetical protein BsWGS_28657 [Bradybaena similaris]